MNLLKIGEEFRALDNLLEEAEGDISDPVAEAAVVEWFENLAKDESLKLDGYFYYIQEQEMEADKARELAKALTFKANVRTNRVAHLKKRMLAYLMGLNRKDAITASGHKITVNKNTTKPVEIAEGVKPEDVPAEFKRVSVEFDADAIRKSLKDGTLPFAKLGEAGHHIRLKA